MRVDLDETLGRNFTEGGEALERATQRSCGCPFLGSIQGLVGWGFWQPGIVEGIPAHGSRLDEMIFKVPSSSHQSMIL